MPAPPSATPAPCTTRRSARAGFSLIELLIVVAIAGVIAAIAVPKMARNGERQRVVSGASHVARELAAYADRARVTGRSHGAQFTGQGDGIVYYELAGGSRVEIGRLDLITSPHAAQLWRSNANPQPYVIFDAAGAATSTVALAVVVGELFVPIKLAQGIGPPVVGGPSLWTAAERGNWTRITSSVPIAITVAELAASSSSVPSDAIRSAVVAGEAVESGKADAKTGEM